MVNHGRIVENPLIHLLYNTLAWHVPFIHIYQYDSSNMIRIVLLFAFLLSTCHAAIRDFCVADLNATITPSGYPCKSPETVTVNDFVFSSLQAGNPSGMFKFAFSPALVAQLPGLNGLGLSVARLDLDAGGATPMHSHADASEVILVVEGQITAGFISSDNSVFVETLSQGDLMVFPRGLLHFQINAFKGTSAAYLIFSDPNPAAQIVDATLFGNNLDSSFVAKTTLLDRGQIKKLKAAFGGTD
ncbi:hypothetical protein VNO77_06554 [Canavalia gladiata]|uniref:Germin-like protein n=1 Tax=Canavalia gladiata TaxID=3824 RepID=A0AAN9QSZ4_CANGL